MKLPPRVRTYAFWLALSSALVLLAQSIGKLFGMDVQGSIIENVVMSICGVLVVLGIVSKSDEDTNAEDKPDNDSDTDEQNK